jgi:hypothetical protein
LCLVMENMANFGLQCLATNRSIFGTGEIQNWLKARCKIRLKISSHFWQFRSIFTSVYFLKLSEFCSVLRAYAKVHTRKVAKKCDFCACMVQRTGAWHTIFRSCQNHADSKQPQLTNLGDRTLDRHHKRRPGFWGELKHSSRASLATVSACPFKPLEAKDRLQWVWG